MQKFEWMRATVLCLVLAGCAVRPQVDVYFDAEPEALEGVSDLRVVVLGSDNVAVFERSLSLSEFDLRNGDVGLTLVSEGNVRSRTWRVVATLETESGDVRNRQTAVGSYGSGRQRVNLRFYAACTERTCDAACDEGECVEPCVGLDDIGNEAPTQRIECSCDVAGNGAPCDIDGEAGRCWDGSCCTGCFDGENCVAAQTETACGTNGAECAQCCEAESCNVVLGVCQSEVARILVGDRHACVHNSLDQEFCWGGNESGQVGDGTRIDRAEPFLIPMHGTIAPGDTHTCFFTYEGEVSCWGSAANGKLGFWDEDQLTPPDPVEGSFRIVKPAEDYTCGVEEGRVVCWGTNGNGQRGNSGPPSPAPFFEAIGTDFVRLDANRDTTCAIRADGTMYCQGRNSDGQAGVAVRAGDDTDERMTVAAHPDIRWRDVDMGFFGGCGITVDDELLCWGGVRTTILGEDDLALRGAGTLHETVMIPGRWSQVSVGQSHLCAIRTDESLWCVGSNSIGQLGVAPEDMGSGLQQVDGVGWRWVRVGVGDEFTCAQRSGGGGVYCWGSNENLQLGQNALSSTNEPTRVCFPQL